MLSDTFGKPVFSFPKSLYAVIDCIKIANCKIMISFWTISQALATAHALLILTRRWRKSKIYSCRNGEYFDTVTKPRIEKVIYSEDWKDGKPVSRKGSSRIQVPAS